jgi:hypothetical protein
MYGSQAMLDFKTHPYPSSLCRTMVVKSNARSNQEQVETLKEMNKIPSFTFPADRRPHSLFVCIERRVTARIAPIIHLPQMIISSWRAPHGDTMGIGTFDTLHRVSYAGDGSQNASLPATFDPEHTHARRIAHGVIHPWDSNDHVTLSMGTPLFTPSTRLGALDRRP